MKKKTLILLAVCLSLITMLGTACGNSGNSASESTKETAISADEKQEEKNDRQESVSKEAAVSDSETDSINTESTEKETSESTDTEKTDNSVSEKGTTATETYESSESTEIMNTETETPVSATDEITDERLSTLMDQVASALPSGNGNWSFYVCDLATGHESSYENHQMQAASLIKLYIMGAVYEDYDNLTAAYGKETIDNNLYYMITVSDNDCANNLTKYLGSSNSSDGTGTDQEADSAALGMAVVNQFCQEHGFNESHMGRLLLASNELDDNYTSVSDCGHFLKSIRSGNTDEFPHAEDMFNLLSQQQRRHKIPSQLPEGVSVANKTGELDNVENDAGIIYNVENELVIVFMSDSLTEVGNAQTAIGSLAKMIYSYYNN